MASTNQETFAGHMGDIAAAIRAKTGKTDSMAVRDMAGEIESIIPASFVGKSLSTYTWPEIVRIAEAIPANPGPWSYLVGQSKNIDLGTYGTASCLVVGTNHDTIAGTSKKAGLTFMVRKALFSLDGISSSPNKYNVSHFREAVLGALDQFPDDVRPHVKTVAKTSRFPGTNSDPANSSSDPVWAFSLTELGMSTYESPSRYEYFGSSFDGSTLTARRKMEFNYSLRSPYGSNNFYYINSGGGGDSGGFYNCYAVVGFCL